MASKLLLLSFLTILSLQNTNSARILAIVPTASYSHQMFFQQIWRELAIRGHDMVIITTDPTGEKLPNFKEVSIKENYVPFRKMMEMFVKENIFHFLLNDSMTKLSMEIIEHQIMLPQVQEIITNQSDHFDLLMIEHFPGIYFGLKHKYKCPVIGVTSLDAFPASHEAMGNPVHNVLYPLSLLPYQEDLTFVQRVITVAFKYLFYRMQGNNEIWVDELSKKLYGPDTPPIRELFDQTDMLFVNANPLLTPVRPYTPSTINIAGGVHMKKPKELPQDLKDYLDIKNSANGVIYFSLGTNVKTKDLSLDTRQIFMNTLSQLPYNVLWKFEDDTLPGKPENVKITKWAPQQDILRHPNVKLFITQGGIQSLEETLYSHVPVVVLPFLGDQEANAVKVQTKKLGVMVDRHTLTEENFKAAILEVMNNPVYGENVKQLAARIQDEPMTPLEKAIWWTEYVLRHNGAQHLKGPKIPNWQFYYLDVLAVLFGVLIVLCGIVFGVVKMLIKGGKKLFGKKSNDKVKGNKKKQ